jgi:hypothetical protein
MAKRHNQIGDVAIEPRFRKADKRVKQSFAMVYERGTEHISASAIQRYLTSKDIKFVPKQANVAGMQICDIIAHPSYRSMKMEREGVPEPDDFGTEIAHILLDKKYSRDPDSGIILGWGRKWLP